jgi:hypothetical protein
MEHTIILIGDCNAKIETMLDTKIKKNNHTKKYNGFIKFIKKYKLTDTYRHVNSNKREYTWRRSNYKPITDQTQETRIDYILTNDNTQVIMAKIHEANSLISKDHSLVTAVFLNRGIQLEYNTSIEHKRISHRKRFKTYNFTKKQITKMLNDEKYKKEWNLDAITEILKDINNMSYSKEKIDKLETLYISILNTTYKIAEKAFGTTEFRETAPEKQDTAIKRMNLQLIMISKIFLAKRHRSRIIIRAIAIANKVLSTKKINTTDSKRVKRDKAKKAIDKLKANINRRYQTIKQNGINKYIMTNQKNYINNNKKVSPTN